MASFFDIAGPTQAGSTNSGDDSLFPQLTYRERLMGFAACSAMGYFIQLMSFGSLIGLIAGNPTKFALSYTFGNMLALAGTGFLIGFKKQFQNMTDKERLITSIVFGASLIMIFISAFLLKSKLLVLLFLIIEFCAYTWYVASYIPFAKTCIKNCITTQVSKITGPR